MRIVWEHVVLIQFSPQNINHGNCQEWVVVRIFSADLIHGKGHLFWPFKARRVSIKAGHIILSWIHALPKMINICRRKGRYFTHIDTLCKYCKPIWTVIGSIFDPLSIENFSLFFVKCKDWEFKYLQAIEFTCYWTWQCIVKIIYCKTCVISYSIDLLI